MVVNEGALEAAISTDHLLGPLVSFVRFEGCSLREQMQLVLSARAMVAVHGQVTKPLY